MRRNVSLEEISDGRLYGYNDMVKADCHGCAGCHKCCSGMGSSIVLDPYDMWRLFTGAGLDLQRLLSEERVELQVADGCVLPNLKMAGAGEQCAFLNGEGRCGIYEYRPGICRLFPLGRYYENGDFRFFLQTGECSVKNRTKVKVGKWIDTPLWSRNHDFLCSWHALLKDVERAVSGREDSEYAKELNMGLLTEFYHLEEPSAEDFYQEFDRRLEQFRKRYEL